MARSKRSPGEINRNGQLLVAKTDEPGSDHMQYIWLVACIRSSSPDAECGHFYGSNRSDFFQRKCPRCQGGRAGPSIENILADKEKLAELERRTLQAALTEGEESGIAEEFDIDAFLERMRA